MEIKPKGGRVTNVPRQLRSSKRLAFAADAWARLAAERDQEVPTFDPSSLAEIPAPARRLLDRALQSTVRLTSTVVLEMEGRIRLGRRWYDFRADQILRRGVGLVWAPVVGGRILRFVGADVLDPLDARMEFRFHDRFPVVRTSGPDVRRSAVGRLAAETVVWLPQALTPQMGARWSGLDDQRATVSLDVAEEIVDVEVTVGSDGQLRRLDMERWNNSTRPPTNTAFGGSVTSSYTASNGVRIAGSGIVGWNWRSPHQLDEAFFEYDITNASFDVATS